MSPAEQALLGCYRSLDETAKNLLTEFAVFLSSRHPHLLEMPKSEFPPEIKSAPIVLSKTTASSQPIMGESVMGALKRLSGQYPHLNKGKMLDLSSPLVGQHLMGGRPADEVVAELEVLFRQQAELASL